MIESEKIVEAFREGWSSPTWQGKVVVVGAGVAGLTAAQILKKSGVEVILLEASSKWGGRVYSRWDDRHRCRIELGAEEIHGKNTAWHALLAAFQKDLLVSEDYFDDYYYLHGKLWAEEEIEQYEEFKKALRLWEKIEAYHGKEDLSISHFLRKERLPAYLEAILEAWIGNEYGSSNTKISIQSLVEAGQKWSAGEQSFVFIQHTYQEVLGKIFEEVIPTIQHQKIVKRIDYSPTRVRLITHSGEALEADKAIVTVPLNPLKENQIQFVPSLPSKHTIALHNLGMDQGLKLVLAFKECFWEEETGSIYGSEIIPEFYTSPQEDCPLLTAYVMGDKARHLARQGPARSEKIALDILDQMYGFGQATALFERSFWLNWGDQPFIKGAYSYPSPRAQQYRQQLSESIENRIFFAGEALNLYGHSGTVHGALESAYHVVEGLLS